MTYWEELEEGAVYETAARTLTESDLLLYAGLSGDWNEIHTNEEMAQESPFGTRIAYGPLGITFAFGLMSRLGLWEGTGLAILGLEWGFSRPVLVGDTLRVRMTIRSTRPTSRADRGLVVRGIEVVNQDGQVVQEGMITMLIARRPTTTAPRDDKESLP